MGHPAKLLKQVADLLEQDYPVAHGYRMVFEKALPGTRTYPDIRVDDRAGSIVCVVEIGYTRGEKFGLYRSRGIPDVRWYDKQGRLNTAHERVNKHITVSLSVEPSHSFTVWAVLEAVDCWAPDCFQAAGDAEDEDEDDEDDDDVDSRFTSEQAERRAGVLTYVITDYVRSFFPSYCDKCDRVFVANPRDQEADDLLLVFQETRPVDLGREFNRVFRGNWGDAKAWVQNAINLDLEHLQYLEGAVLREDLLTADINLSLQRFRAEAVREQP